MDMFGKSLLCLVLLVSGGLYAQFIEDPNSTPPGMLVPIERVVSDVPSEDMGSASQRTNASLRFTIIESQSTNPGHDMDVEWQAFLGALPLKKVSWIKRTEDGNPADTILKAAASEKADLIVMGTHGRTGLNHMLLGSVTEKVARRAECPVLTIGPGAFEFTLP